MTYEEFTVLLRRDGEHRATQGGLVAIPDFRRRVAIESQPFDQYVLRLHAEGLIHLLSHVDGEKLPEPVRRDCIVHSSGALLYWIRWL